MSDHSRTSDLENEFFAKFLLLRLQRILQLQQTTLAQGVISGPIGFVEGAARGVDGAVHVSLRRVGDLAQHFFRGRVDVGERAGLTVDELAVDHHLRFETDRG